MENIHYVVLFVQPQQCVHDYMSVYIDICTYEEHVICTHLWLYEYMIRMNAICLYTYVCIWWASKLTRAVRDSTHVYDKYSVSFVNINYNTSYDVTEYTIIRYIFPDKCGANILIDIEERNIAGVYISCDIRSFLMGWSFHAHFVKIIA